MKKISMLIAVVSVLGAMAQSALAQNLVAFSGGVGDITTGSTDTTVLGVPAAGQIWVIRDLTAEVKVGGGIRVDGRGLLLGAGNGIGSNAGASVFATGSIIHLSELRSMAGRNARASEELKWRSKARVYGTGFLGYSQIWIARPHNDGSVDHA